MLQRQDFATVKHKNIDAEVRSGMLSILSIRASGLNAMFQTLNTGRKAEAR